MKRIIPLILVFIFMISLSINAQSIDIEFGVKAGANYSQFTPDLMVDGVKFANYKGKLGYYLGGFLNLEITEKWQFQPEFLVALQGSRIVMEDVETQGGFNSSPMLSDFESRVNDLTLVLPLEIRCFITNDFFVETGPQIGYIIDRKYKAEDNSFQRNTPFEINNSNDPNNFEYDKFEFGVNLGTGYKFSDNLTISARYFPGLIERDNSIKSSVLNLGLELKL